MLVIKLLKLTLITPVVDEPLMSPLDLLGRKLSPELNQLGLAATVFENLNIIDNVANILFALYFFSYELPDAIIETVTAFSQSVYTVSIRIM